MTKLKKTVYVSLSALISVLALWDVVKPVYEVLAETLLYEEEIRPSNRITQILDSANQEAYVIDTIYEKGTDTSTVSFSYEKRNDYNDSTKLGYNMYLLSLQNHSKKTHDHFVFDKTTIIYEYNIGAKLGDKVQDELLDILVEEGNMDSQNASAMSKNLTKHIKQPNAVMPKNIKVFIASNAIALIGYSAKSYFFPNLPFVYRIGLGLLVPVIFYLLFRVLVKIERKSLD